MIPFEFEKYEKLVNQVFVVFLEKGQKNKLVDLLMKTLEVRSKPTQTSKMGIFRKMVNSF